jgi:hypothetical protein
MNDKVKVKELEEFVTKHILPSLSGSWRLFNGSAVVQIHSDVMVGYCFRTTRVDRVSIMFFIKLLSIPIECIDGIDITISRKVMIARSGFLNSIFKQKSLYQFRWGDRFVETDRILSLINSDSQFPIRDRLNYEAISCFLSKHFSTTKNPVVLRTRGLVAAHLNDDDALALLSKAKEVHEQASVDFANMEDGVGRARVESERARQVELEIEAVKSGSIEAYSSEISRSSLERITKRLSK